MPEITPTTLVDLKALLDARNVAWAAMGNTHEFLGEMDASKRLEMDRQSRIYRNADAAIVSELRRLKRPVKLNGVTLHLTSDLLNFVELDPSTGLPIYQGQYQHHGIKGTLFNYNAGMRHKSNGRG